jgi:predicted MPP superfamily phosphohydrolase
MDLTWLHISDFHIRSGDPYDRDVVLRALVKSVEEFRRTNRSPDLILATGDVAYSGKAEEYDLATKLFDDLIDAAGLEKNRLFIIPGNHDVDRSLSIGLARTLESREECDGYFNAEVPKPHLVQKLGAFLKWHNDYFKGIRAMPADSTCGPVELMKIRGHKIGILPVNTALFSRDDNDHDKLLVGRRCLDVAIERFRALTPDFRIALMHHPRMAQQRRAIKYQRSPTFKRRLRPPGAPARNRGRKCRFSERRFPNLRSGCGLPVTSVAQ